MKYDFVSREIVGVWGASEANPMNSRVEKARVVLVNDAIVAETRQYVSACEHCAENAGISFDYLLDSITGCDPTTDYLICRPATCPCCSRELTEKTLVVAG
jgi:hypothetical protein